MEYHCTALPHLISLFLTCVCVRVCVCVCVVNLRICPQQSLAVRLYVPARLKPQSSLTLIHQLGVLSMATP